MVKISQNWPTYPVSATPQALRLGPVGSVSFQDTIMAANMILDTSHNTQQVKKMVCKTLKLHIGAKIDNICIFSWLRLREFQFFAIYEKTDGFRA